MQDAALPADILIAPGGPESAGLDVTIAAATPDLRDRFRAAADELHAELSAIGAEVDAIHVELRSDLADGGSGPGDNSAQESAAQAFPGDQGADWADSGWTGDGQAESGRDPAAGADIGGGASDAMARGETIDPASDASDADVGGAGQDDAERDGSGRDAAGRDAAGRGRAGQDGAGPREVERLRLLLNAGSAVGQPGSAEADRVSPGRTHRIDRYA